MSMSTSMHCHVLRDYIATYPVSSFSVPLKTGSWQSLYVRRTGCSYMESNPGSRFVPALPDARSAQPSMTVSELKGNYPSRTPDNIQHVDGYKLNRSCFDPKAIRYHIDQIHPPPPVPPSSISPTDLSRPSHLHCYRES